MAESNTDTDTTTSMSTAQRRLPNRSKSEAAAKVDERGDTSSTRRLPNRSKSSADGGRVSSKKSRKKKHGIRVAITVRKATNEEQQEEQQSRNSTNTTSSSTSKDTEEHVPIYHMEVHCVGKYSRKGNWPDVNSFWEGKEVDKDTMCDILDEYSHEQYPDRRGVENTRPKRCYLRDEPLRGISFYKDYDWDPVKLNLKGDDKKVDILESWTKNVTLESIPVDFSTDLDTILIEQGDKAVTSTLKKSKLQGHPLAMSMMASETQIVTELRGLESVVGVLGNDETPDEVNEETGESVWRDVKTLRALLHDKPKPQREGKGQQRVVEVVALETYLKARVNYSASFEGDVVSDHGVGLLLGERWWAHPLKDIMRGFGAENSALIYEDIELRFYSEIGYKMENEYFDWENHGGKWVKVKKQRNP
jgi:hypothetical protein